MKAGVPVTLNVDFMVTNHLLTTIHCLYFFLWNFYI